MTDPVRIVESISKIYESKILKTEEKERRQSFNKRYVDEVHISVEGKKKQILENILLEAIDELPTKKFEK